MSFARLNRIAAVLVLVILCAWIFSPRAGAESDDSGAWSPASAGQCGIDYENQIETDHFILKWTGRSPHSANNITDPAIVTETAGLFEAAWNKLTGLFGREPYTSPGTRKITIVFKDLECYAFADPPEGPIELNASVWMSNPSIRPTTCAHELFHKLQYAYGYKTRWAPRPPVQWFTEGTAAWAEVFVCGRVTRSCKMEDMFKDTKLDLYEAEDMALPFWIYFVSGNRNTPRDELMVRFFEKYEATGNAKKALYEVIRDSYGSVGAFFSRFAAERRYGFWREPAPGLCPYTHILGPDEKDLVAEIKEYQHKGKDPSARPVKVQ